MGSQLFSNDRPESCLKATLHHIILSSPEPTRLANFYHQALGYEIEQRDGLWLGRALDRHIAFTDGEAKGLSGAGYALPNTAELARLQARIEAAGWAHQPGRSPFFRESLAVRDPDGTLFTFGIPHGTHTPTGKLGCRAARIQHVVVASRAPDRIVRFFQDVLGFTLSDNVVDEGGGVRTSFLRCSQEHHSFAVFKASEDRLDHHCYELTDWNLIRDWGDHMAAERIPLKWGPGRHGPGNNLFFFVHDPDDNWVELSAELEVVSHDHPVGMWPHEEHTLNLWGQGLLRS
jgi:catechol 2,3-dioxygenase